MKLFKQIFLNLLKILFCLYATGAIFYTHYVFWGQEMTFQMKIYMLILVILAVLNWFILFSKLKSKFKIAIVIITILFGYSTPLFTDVAQAFKAENCLDSQICE